jgi:hypothetical protein
MCRVDMLPEKAEIPGGGAHGAGKPPCRPENLAGSKTVGLMDNHIRRLLVFLASHGWDRPLLVVFSQGRRAHLHLSS